MASVPKVIYASRTHSQLSQVVRELKTLRENGYDINMSVLGGRGGMGFSTYNLKVSLWRHNQIIIDRISPKLLAFTLEYQKNPITLSNRLCVVVTVKVHWKYRKFSYLWFQLKSVITKINLIKWAKWISKHLEALSISKNWLLGELRKNAVLTI